jgi:DNA-binding NarL/FixJ family response regulator
MRIFLVDEEKVVRRGLELLLSRQADLEICGAAGPAEGALSTIALLKPDLAVLGLTLRTAASLKLMRRLRKFCPEVKILVFAMEDKFSFVKLALKAGAHGFVAKQEGSENLLEGVRRLLAPRSLGAPGLPGKSGTDRPAARPR